MAVAKLFLLLALAAPILGNLNFLTVGDWGGIGSNPYTTPGETGVAAGMGLIGAQLGAQFVLGLGDNFYDTGIQGDASNFRFGVTFENVYKQAPLQVPWFLVAGNHDHGGNVTAQIAYTQISKRWKFPDFYYLIQQKFTDDSGAPKTLDLVFIDTVLLAGNTDDNLEDFMPPPGPANHSLAEDQWQWIEAQLANSRADYLWVVGHYPVWSACSHGPTQVLVSRLKPMLEKYHATGYLSGHDHCLEYFDDNTGPKYVVSGAGKECCYQNSNAGKNPRGALKFILAGTQRPGGPLGGFSSFQLTGRNMTVVFYDDTGKELFATPAIAPRN